MKYIFVAICSLCILCTSCGNESRAESLIIVKDSQEEKGEGQVQAQVDMTEEQKALLTKISVDEESVQEGNVLEWQKEVLRQYDYAIEYLNKKYPSYTFHIVDCDQKNVLNAYTTFSFTEGSNSESYYDLYLEVDEDQYSAKDNFYGYIVGAKYEAKLMELLKQENIPCDRAEVSLNTVQNEEFNESMDINEVLNGNIRMPQSVDFYIESSSIQDAHYEEAFNQIHQLIEDRNIYGSFFVTIYDAANGDEVVYENGFNTFD